MKERFKDYPIVNKSLIFLRKAAIVFFASIAAYMIAIYLDLVFQTASLKIIRVLPLWSQKYVLFPIVLELGLFIAQLGILYLLGRFVEMPRWTAVISVVVMTHLIDASVKFVLGQLNFYYLSWIMLSLRIPGIVATLFAGGAIMKIALRRNDSEKD